MDIRHPSFIYILREPILKWDRTCYTVRGAMEMEKTKYATILPITLLAAMLCMPVVGVFAADLSVPDLELATIGAVEDGDFQLTTLGSIDLAIEGGYKFGGALRFAFAAADLEKALAYAFSSAQELDSSATSVSVDDYNELVDRLTNSTALSFELAKVAIREPFGIPIELAYFIGQADTLCSGDDFPERFGTSSFNTAYRGFAYYPEGINGDPRVQYDGIHAVTGTGISLAWTGAENFIPMLYAYQDSAIAVTSSGDIDRGRYSFDARFLFNGKNTKLEAFVGATVPYSDMGIYRGGILAYVSTGTGAEFLTQAGVTYWDPSDSFGIDNLYVLFEPRVDFGFTSIIVTLFYHPAWYLQQSTGEQGATDVNFKLLFGSLAENNAEGGIESTIGLKGGDGATSLQDSFKLSVGPFFGIVTEGVRWDFKLRVLPLNFTEPAEMIQTYIGVRTAF